MSAGGAVTLIIVALVMATTGGFLIWFSYVPAGIQWNSTHNRALQPIPYVSHAQETYNSWAGRVFAPVVIILSVIMFVLGVQHL